MSIFASIVRRDPNDRGFSADGKYRAETDGGAVYFLRISPPEKRERREWEYRHMEQAAKLGVSMCDPVEFGECPGGVYTIQRWVEGKDAEAALPGYSEAEQYAFGLEAGRMLRKLHTIPAPEGIEDWQIRYGRKIDDKLRRYEECPLKYENGQAFVDFLHSRRHLLAGRPQTWQHGDYHCGNLMIDSAGRLTVIDFDRADYGDPWNEFNRIIWDVRAAPRFACGMLDGYFGGEIPGEFWGLLAVYLSCNMLSSLPWAMDFGQKEIDIARRNAQRVLEWYDGFQRIVPGWYRKG